MQGTLPIAETAPDSVTDAIARLFQDLHLEQAKGGPTVDKTQVGLGVEAGYAFQLGTTQGLQTTLPVLLAKQEVSTAVTSSSGTCEDSETPVPPATFAKCLVQALQGWNAKFSPQTNNSSVTFDLTIYAPNSQQPLARLRNVQTLVGDEKWWG